LGAGMRGFKDSLSGESTQPSLSAPPSEPVASAGHTTVPAPAPVATPVVAAPPALAPAATPVVASPAGPAPAAPVVPVAGLGSVAGQVSEAVVAPVQEPGTSAA